MILDDWSQSRIKPHFQGTPMLPAQRELVIYLVFTLINLRSLETRRSILGSEGLMLSSCSKTAISPL